jgi:hypothetical protein
VRLRYQTVKVFLVRLHLCWYPLLHILKGSRPKTGVKLGDVLRTSWVLISACLLASATVAPAATISFQGNFTNDNNVMLFYYSVANTGPVTIETTSFNATDLGFSPILTVFSASGAFQFENVGYSNPIASDASLSWNSLGGENYIVALTQYDNSAVENFDGGNQSAGFLHDLDVDPNFTALSPFNDIPGGSFLLPGSEQRSSFWAVDFTSADPTLQAAVPEPSTAVSSVAGGVMLAAWFAARRRKGRANQPATRI